MIDVYSHNHRHAARPGENGDMAAGASPAQYQPAVTPIGGQKHRRRHVVGRDDNSCRHDLIGFTCQMPQHAITQIAQIGCTGAEIRIVGPIVRCDFRIDRSAPRPIGDLATGDQLQTPAPQDYRLRAAQSGKREWLPRHRPPASCASEMRSAWTPPAHRRGPGAPPPQIDIDGHHASREPNARAVPARFRGRRTSLRCDEQLDAFYRPS